MAARRRIRLYVCRWCTECERAVALLELHDLAFERTDVGDPENCCRLREVTGGTSVPQAVVDGRPIGGYDDLATLIRAGFPASSTEKGLAP
jgi:glutaredoxin 3